MDYKNYNEYISQKNANLSTTNTNKFHLNCDIIEGSVVNGVRQPLFFSFVLDKPSGHKAFCEPETFHIRKINKFVLNTILVYLEYDIIQEINFKREMLTFTMQMIKI